MKRLFGFDFLRGVAITLVMLHHAEAGRMTTRMGWIGVDLFFVLSGFLVSGLLFAEYKATQTIQPIVFLLRRGFKIYPLFCFVLVCHLGYFYYKGITPDFSALLAEVFFYQNYEQGIINVTWSLAVEEHFYFFLVILLFVAIKRTDLKKGNAIPLGCLLISAICLCLRAFVFNKVGYVNVFVNNFPTHLRIDSLCFGVLISYLYHFRRARFLALFKRHSNLLLILSVFLIAPVFIWETTTWQINIWGYTLLYMGFGIWVGWMLEHGNNMGTASNNIVWFIFRLISRIGENSYAIYLCHFIVGSGVANWICTDFFPKSPHAFYVMVFVGVSILVGALLTVIIEKPFLKLRDVIYKSYKPVQR